MSTLCLTVLATFLRFFRLSEPHSLVFDETYYVKDAYAMLKTGVDHDWIPSGSSVADIDELFVNGVQDFLDTGSFVVHPPLGKWLIALGIDLGGGIDSSFAWRFSTAVFSVLAVFVMIRVANRIFGVYFGILAGLFFATDGVNAVLGRTALLDTFAMFFVLLAFYLLVVDWQTTYTADDFHELKHSETNKVIAFFTKFRIFRLLAIFSFALSMSIKWTGICFAFFFMAVSLIIDYLESRGYKTLQILRPKTRVISGAETGADFSSDSETEELEVINVQEYEIDEDAIDVEKVAENKWVCFRKWLSKFVIPNVLISILITGITYVIAWIGWLTTSAGYDRNWAETHPGEGFSFLPDALNSLIHYHEEIFGYHANLDATHPYQSPAPMWLFNIRPTLFYFKQIPFGEDGCNIQEGCVRTINCLGNPILWWLSLASLIAIIALLIHDVVTRKFVIAKDVRVYMLLAGIIAGWGVWFFFSKPVYHYYTLAFLPYFILCLIFMLQLLCKHVKFKVARVFVVSVTLLVLLSAYYFMPIWLGTDISYDDWLAKMWFESWI